MQSHRNSAPMESHWDSAARTARREGTRFVPVVPDQTCTEPRRSGDVLWSVAMPGFCIDVAWLWPGERFIPVREILARITTKELSARTTSLPADPHLHNPPRSAASSGSVARWRTQPLWVLRLPAQEAQQSV